jgi:hypothetical protein
MKRIVITVDDKIAAKVLLSVVEYADMVTVETIGEPMRLEAPPRTAMIKHMRKSAKKSDEFSGRQAILDHAKESSPFTSRDVQAGYTRDSDRKAIANAMHGMRVRGEVSILGGDKTKGFIYELVRGDNGERLLPNDEESRQATQD